MIGPFPSLALIRRELFSSLRRGRSFLFAALFVASAISIVVSIWPEGRFPVIQAGTVSRDIQNGIIVLAVMAGFVFIPGLAGAALTSEKENDTYELLALTLVRPGGIIAAKLAGALGLFLLLLGAIMPVAATVFFLVGTDWSELLIFAVLILLLAVHLGLIGLACSAIVKKTYIAVVLSYLMVMVSLLAYSLFFGELIPLAEALRGPWDALLGLVMVLGSYLTVTAACFAAARAMLLRPAAAAAQTATAGARAFTVGVRASRVGVRASSPHSTRAAKPPIPDRVNPMFAKEHRWGTLNRPMVMILSYIGALAVFLAAAGIAGLFDTSLYNKVPENLGTAIIVHIIMSLFLTSALCATSLTKEREAGNLDFLRLTLLSPARIVMGKLKAGIMAAFPLFAASMTIALVFSFFHPADRSFTIIITGAVTFALYIIVSLCLGLLASTFARNSITAIFLSYGLAIIFFLGILLVAVIRDLRMILPSTPDTIYYLSPMDTFAQAIVFRKYKVVIPECLFSFFFYAAAIAGIIALTISGVSRRWMRDR